MITEHTLLDLLFNALVCVFLLHYLSFKFKIMVHVRGAQAGASGILPSRAGICDLIAIGGGGWEPPPPIVMSLYWLKKQPSAHGRMHRSKTVVCQSFHDRDHHEGSRRGGSVLYCCRCCLINFFL